MKLHAKTLHRILYNSLLWAPGKGDAKKSPSEGLIQFSFLRNQFFVLGTDGYVVSVDRGDPDGNEGLPLESVYAYSWDVREVERALRGVDESVIIDLHHSLEDQRILIFEIPNREVGFELHKPKNLDFWKAVGKLVALKKFKDVQQNVAIAPARFSKFSLLEPKEQYPVDFRFGFDDNLNQFVVAWKYGPDTRGVFAPLDRNHLREVYDNSEEVLW